MVNVREKSSEASLLAGPAMIKIHVTSPRGPFAIKGANLAIPQSHISLVNTSTNSVLVKRLVFDALQRSESGITTESHLTAEVAQREFEPNESIKLVISGFVPATAGIYTSILRVMLHDGTQFSTNVVFNVAARPVWGVACMIFGLALVGVINSLDSESGIQGELRRALLARQAAHDFFLHTPPPQSLGTLVENADREFDAAIQTLQKSRSLSFADHRSADAQEHLSNA